MLRRFVNGPWPAILGLCLGILSVPGMLEDAAAWWGWFAEMPRAVSLALLAVGSLLLLRYLFASRERIQRSTLRVLSAAGAGRDAFRYHFRPQVRTALWADLDSGQPTADAKHEDDQTSRNNQWEVIEHTIEIVDIWFQVAFPTLKGER